MTDQQPATAALAPLTPARLREEVLTLTCQVPLTQTELWRRITEPDELVRWSPVVPNRGLDEVGPATSVENEGDEPADATVVEARSPWHLEHLWGTERLTWQLAPSGEGTQLNLVHELSDPSAAAAMAAGWHLCLDVLVRRARGEDAARRVGEDAMAQGWPVLRDRYAQMLGDQG